MALLTYSLYNDIYMYGYLVNVQTNCFYLQNWETSLLRTPCFLPWVHEKFTVEFTMSNVDGCTIYMPIGCLNSPEELV